MKIVKYSNKVKEIPGFLRDRFGRHVAQISTDTTLKLRSSVKDVARVILGEVPWEIEELSKRFMNAPQGVTDRDHVFGYDRGEGWVQGSIEYDPALREFIRKYPKIWDVTKMCLSLRRGTGRHASAYVLANRPIEEFIPTVEISGVKCTQYTATSVEKSGAIKYDFLSVNSLKDVSEAIKLVQINSKLEIPEFLIIDGIKVPQNRLLPRNGRFYDIWNLPEDLEVFKDIAKGNTETVFQLSTKGAKDWLRYFDDVRPDGTPLLKSIKDLAIFTALDRPGPLDAYVEDENGRKHNMLVEYTRRVRGLKWSETPKVFAEVLKSTYGILIMQESVQELYQKITDCSLSEAEKFRYNVGKKKKAEIEKVYPIFMEAASKKYGQEEAQKCWDAIQTFSNYGFCKAHATSYMTTAYACAYLKHYFTLEWWCAVLSNAEKDEVNEEFWQYCGHLIDLPDIKHSGFNFSVNNGRILAPISLLNGIGETAHRQLCQYMPYSDIQDFCNKLQKHKESSAVTTSITKLKKDKKTGKEVSVLETKVKLGLSALNRRVVYMLIISGVLDRLFPDKMSIMEKLDKYEQCLALASGKKKKEVPGDYKSIDDLIKYQLKKTILPAYSAPLLPLLKNRYNIKYTSDGYKYVCDRDNFDLVNNSVIKKWDSQLSKDGYKPYGENNKVVVGFILTTRVFSYDSGRKKACELTFDLDGCRYTVVKWPNDAGELPQHFNSKLDGSISALILRKTRTDKPMTLVDAKVLLPPIDLKERDKKDE